jgi:hypothetical protein
MKSIVGILCLLFLLLTACEAPAPGKPEKEVNLTIPQETTWEQAKEMILAGKVRTITQFHDLKVILDLKDGSQLTITEPAIDEVFRVVEQCGAKCENMGLITE